jgi:hypothetical protein
VNLYGFVGNDGVNRTDHLGLVEVEYLPPDAAAIMPIIVPDGESGTEYPKKIVRCRCNSSCDIECTVGFTAKITVSLAQAKSQGTTWMGIFGHEQRHVLSRILRVNENVVEPLRQEEGDFNNAGVCKRRAEVLQRDYQRKLNDQLNHRKTPDHADDPNPNEHTPGSKVPYDPLPGSLPGLGGPIPA